MENFGSFSKKEIIFKPGINVVYGRNEAGKTTIYQFVLSMMSIISEKHEVEHNSDKNYMIYRPRKNPSVFNGVLEYEDNYEHISIYRDFLENEAYIEGYGKKYSIHAFHELNEKKEKYIDSPILGIHQLSEESGQRLLNEAKERILDLRSTGNGVVSFRGTMKVLSELKEQLERDQEYRNLLDEEAKQKQKLFDIENRQEKVRKLALKYRDCQMRLEGIESEINRLEKIINKKNDAIVKNTYSELEALNHKILKTSQLCENLEAYKSISSDQVERYLEQIQEIQKTEEELITLEQLNQSYLEQMKVIEENLCLQIIEYFSDESFADTVIVRYRYLIDQKEQEYKLNKDIDAIMAEIEDEEIRQKGKEEAIGKIDKLTKDYYMISLAMGRKEKLSQQIESYSDEALQKEMKKLSKRLLKDRLLTVFFMMLLLVGAISGTLQYVNMYIAVALAAVGMIGFIGVFYRSSKLKKKLVSQRLAIDRQKEITEDTIKQEQEAQDEIKDILNRNHCKQVKDFELYYSDYKQSLEMDLLRVEKCKELRGEIESIGKSILQFKPEIEEVINRLKQGGKTLTIFTEDSYDLLLECIGLSQKYIRLKRLVAENKRRAFHMKEEGQAVKKIIEASVLERLNIKSIQDYQEKREEWIRTNERLRFLEKEKEKLTKSIQKSKKQIEKEELAYSGSYLQELEKEKGRQEKEKKEMAGIKQEMHRLRGGDSLHYREAKLLESIENRLENYNEQIEDLEIVEKMLVTASKQLASTYQQEISQNIQRTINKIIGKEYEVNLSEEGSIDIYETKNQCNVSVSELSMGTLDQIYFALQIALIDRNLGDEEIPLVLDDVFVHYDDERLIKILELLANLKRQVILMTCHQRERSLLNKLKIPFHYVPIG